VLALLAEGKSNREIAELLVISEATAKLHVRHILEKLGARSRTEAALQATAELDL
jgi:DNA-binding NarL/FixJ family response regulator